MKRTPLCLACCLMTAAILLMVAARAHAVPPPLGIASTWLAIPTSGNWNSNTNWSPPLAPNGPSDEAIFASSSITSVSLSANTQVDGIIFNSGASAFTITAAPAFANPNSITLTISGVGITNNSGITQNLATHVGVNFVRGEIDFENSATAGSSLVITNGGFVQFHDTSTAGGATINNPGSGFGGTASVLDFYDGSTGGSATINNAGSTMFGLAAVSHFHNSSTAGSATINNAGSSSIGNSATNFYDTSTAGSATINNAVGSTGGNGGAAEFQDTSTAVNATINNAGGA